MASFRAQFTPNLLRGKHFIVLLLIGLWHPVQQIVFISSGISFKVFL